MSNISEFDARWHSWLLSGALALAFALFLKPDASATLGFLGLPPMFSSSTWAVIVTALAMVGVFIYMRRVGLDLFGGLATGFAAVVFLSTMYNMGDLALWAIRIIPCVSAVLVVAAFAGDYDRNLLQGMFIAASFYLVCNLVFLLQNSQIVQIDAFESLFFGYRNVTFRVAIPAIVCSALLDALDGRRFSIRTVSVYILSVFETLVGYSATSACALAVIGVVLLLIRWKRIRPWLNGGTYVVAYLAVFFGVVVLRMQDTFSSIIEGVLNRSITFTGRTFIWDKVFQLLDVAHLVKGYGISYMDNAIVLNGVTYSHAHNELLHVALLGGIGAVLLFAIMVILAVRALYLRRGELSSALISAALLGFMVIGLFEVVCYPGAFYFLALAYYRLGGERLHFGREHRRFSVFRLSNRS